MLLYAVFPTYFCQPRGPEHYPFGSMPPHMYPHQAATHLIDQLNNYYIVQEINQLSIPVMNTLPINAFVTPLAQYFNGH